MLSVPLGTEASSKGGLYIGVDADVTASIVGDGLHVFTIDQIETFDIETEVDTHPPQQILVPALKVSGAGPIQAFAGEAILVSVRFSCPVDPPQGAFTATILLQGSSLPAALKIPIVATANLGRLEVVSLTNPSLLPEETQNFDFQIFSSLGHSVQIQFQYSPASDPHFSADTQFPPVIQPGGSANVTVPLFCFPGTPVGEYSVGFTVVTLDGSTTLGSTGIVVSVVGPSVTTVIDPAFASVTMTTGGITPINLNLTSRGGNASVSFELQGTTPGLSLSGPPISVIEGNPTKGTVWINAAMDAPAQATVTLVQHAFNGSQMEALSPSIALSILPPALQGFPPLSFEDFFIVRVYWGQRWID
jgi:hypothetical protein